MGELKRSLPPAGTLYDVQFNNAGQFGAVTGVLKTDASGNLYARYLISNLGVSTGRMYLGTDLLTFIQRNNNSTVRHVIDGSQVLQMKSTGEFALMDIGRIQWSSDGNSYGIPDLGLKRNGPALLKATNGTTGYGGLQLDSSGHMVDDLDNLKERSWDYSEIGSGNVWVMTAPDFSFNFNNWFTSTGILLMSALAYDDDTAAGVGGLTVGQTYQTTGSGAAPLNVAGIVMVKQ